MKNVRLLTLVLVNIIGAIVCKSYAQDLVECRKVVEQLVKAIDESSIEKLKPYLAQDFEVTGTSYSGEIAHSIMDRLLSSLNTKVLSKEEKEVEKKGNGTLFKYEFDYEGIGKTETTILFNESGKIKELYLFSIESKTMKQGFNIQYPEDDMLRTGFSLTGNLIKVNVRLNGVERPFILDTGCPKTILNLRYCEENEDELMRIGHGMEGINGAMSQMDLKEVEELDFLGIKLKNQECIAVSLEHLEQSLETEIYGLIGYDMIKEYDVVFDYETLNLTFINPEKIEHYTKQMWSDKKLTRTPFFLDEHIPVIEANINDKIYRMGIDSGAETNLIDESEYDLLSKYIRKEEEDTLIGGSEHKKKVVSGELKKINIGNHKYKNTRTAFSNIGPINSAYSVQMDGLIGYEILSKQITLLSYKRQEVLFIQ